MRTHFLIGALCICVLNAQPTKPYRVETIAGTLPGDDDVVATVAVLDQPQALVADKNGVIYVSDQTSGIRRITPDGVIHRMQGVGTATMLAADGNGVLYYSLGGPEYYKFDVNRQLAMAFRPTDGVIGTKAITGLAIDADGNLFVADRNVGGGRILRVSTTGVVSVAAGVGSRIALTAAPVRVAVDPSNNLFITGSDRRIVRVSASGEAKVVAGNGAFGAPIDGPRATDSPFQTPGPIVVTKEGELFVGDVSARMVLKINSQGGLETFARGIAISDLALDRDGKLLVADGDGRIWQLKADGSRNPIAGRDQFDGDGGPAVNALLKGPQGVALSPAGLLFIGDTGNNRIRKVSADGSILTVAGNGEAGLGGDGVSPERTQVAGPDLMAMDQEGNLYFAARSFLKVRRLTSDGRIETVAGTGSSGDSGDGGPPISATFRSVDGLAVGRDGNLFISDSQSNRVRVVRRDGTIANYVGTGEFAAGGEGTLASETPLGRPTMLAVDRDGTLVIFESGFARLRRVSGGSISTMSSSVPLGRPGDGVADNLCAFTTVSGLAFDIDSSLLVSGNSVICRLDSNGNSWAVAGGRQAGFAGDGGYASSALLRAPSSMTVAKTGTVYFADRGNHRIRKLEPSASASPAISAGGVTGAGGSSPAVTRLSSGALASIFGTNFTTARSGVSVQASDIVNGVLPTKLADTCVQVDSLRGYVTYVGSQQINFQVPEVPVNTTANVQVIANCGTANEMKSAPVAVQTQSATPEFLYWVRNLDGKDPIIAVNAVTGAYIGPVGLIPGLTFAPARPGDVLTIYCISLGPTNPVTRPGQASAGAAQIQSGLEVKIGTTTVDATNVIYAGASPGTAGLYQLNLRVPVLPDGDHIVSLKLGEFSAPAGGFLAIKN